MKISEIIANIGVNRIDNSFIALHGEAKRLDQVQTNDIIRMNNTWLRVCFSVSKIDTKKSYLYAKSSTEPILVMDLTGNEDVEVFVATTYLL